jgi:DNA-binding transcriptional MerR regulator
VSSVAYAYSPKSAEAFRTISEVADELDVPQHVLRFWESRFAQIRPVKRAGGRRYYRPEDVDLIKGIQALLHGEGFTIKGVQKVLKERGARHVAEVGRKGVIAPSEPVVIEKIVYVQKPAAARKRPTHLRALSQAEMSLPFFDQPTPAVEPMVVSGPNVEAPESSPAFLDGPEGESCGTNSGKVAAEEQARLEVLLDELLALKNRLVAARAGG